MQRNIHFEFYGMPGCGKSAVSEIVAKELEKQGYRVIRASAETGNDVNPLYRKIVKIFRTLGFYILNPSTFSEVKKLVKRNGYTGVREIGVQLVNIAQKLRYYTAKAERTIYIWDEGLTQAAISLAVKGNITGEENKEQLLSIVKANGKQLNIYIRESIETVFNRIDKRATNNSRVEKIKNTQEKVNLLRKYEGAAESIENPDVITGNGREAGDIATTILRTIGL